MGRLCPRSVNATAPFDASNGVNEQRLLGVLRPLAAWFAHMPGGWVDRMSADQICEALRDAGAAFDELSVDAATVLHWLSVDAGILLRAGDTRAGEDPPYLFLHRTFAEYLTAAHHVAQGVRGCPVFRRRLTGTNRATKSDRFR
jgi:hypothetical protein